MSDENSEGNSSAGPLCGERLAAARRDQEIPLADVARELHLDEAKVQALEQNKFDLLGAPVFAKGHLRKYAELVGVAHDDILADYYQLNRSAGAPPIVGPPRKRTPEVDLGRWIAPGLLGLVVFGIVGWWVSAGSPLPTFGFGQTPADIELVRPQAAGDDTDRTTSSGPVDRSMEAADRAPTIDATDDVLPGSQEAVAPAVEEPVSEDLPASTAADPGSRLPQAESSLDPAPDADMVVTLRFSGECWTEMTDASGNRLFFDLGREGREVTVRGAAPLRVLFGSYANVTLTVNGEPYPIPAAGRRGETARFSIEGPGA